MLRVSQAMPNPTRGPLLLTLDLPRRTAVRATVHDVLGREVRVIADGTRDGGVQGVAWDGRDAQGRRAAPGLYLVRIDVGGERFSRRVVVSH
jgi:flagellar hook assembly protein FlgD